MTSYWKEYLCLTYDDKKEYKIFEGRYKHLVKAHKFYDNEVEEIISYPNLLAGKKFLEFTTILYTVESYILSLTSKQLNLISQVS